MQHKSNYLENFVGYITNKFLTKERELNFWTSVVKGIKIFNNQNNYSKNTSFFFIHKQVMWHVLPWNIFFCHKKQFLSLDPVQLFFKGWSQLSVLKLWASVCGSSLHDISWTVTNNSLSRSSTTYLPISIILLLKQEVY